MKSTIHEVFGYVSDCVNNGNPVALVTVTGTEGSSPASPGQVMAVSAGGSAFGTIGGGASEAYITEKVAEALKNSERPFSMSIDHAEKGMVCGGRMEVFINILGNFNGLCIFGGGHIAQSLALIAGQAGFYVTVVEDRPEFESEFKSASYIVCSSGEYDKTDPAKDSGFAVICTRGHSTDDAALRYCLGKDLKYIGMIGSKSKVSELFSKLRSEGIPQPELDRIYAPIGLDIADSAPAEIAIAILAEILLIKNNGSPNHKKFCK